jgi:hypothetical protein
VPISAGVEVTSAEIDRVTLIVPGRVASATLHAGPGAAPLALSCTGSQTTCQPDAVSRCQVPAERASDLVAAMSTGHNIVADLDGSGRATAALDAAGFDEAWARYAAMLREQHGRAVRFVAASSRRTGGAPP